MFKVTYFKIIIDKSSTCTDCTLKTTTSFNRNKTYQIIRVVGKFTMFSFPKNSFRSLKKYEKFHFLQLVIFLNQIW